MQQKTITVVIDQNGDSSVDLEGFAGQGCEKTLKDFQGEDRVKRERRKPAFNSQISDLRDQRLKSGS
jgi:hypothetical protein